MSNIDKYITKRVYNIDASGIEQFKDMSLEVPTSIDELKTILQKAIQQNQNILLRGAGTSLVGSCLPSNDSVVIDISKLDSIHKLTNSDVTVGPGVVLDDLNNYLSKNNLWFPVVIGSHAVAQLGAMVATGAAGMKSIKYDSMGKRVNWIEVMYIDKNQNIQTDRLKGDGIDDFVRSEGILGVITKINLNIISKPTEHSLSFLAFDNLDKVIEKANYYTKNKERLDISAIEIIDKQIANWMDLNDSYYLLVEFENSDSGEITNDKEIQKIWDYRDSCYCVVVSRGYKYIEDPQLELNNAGKLISWLEENNIPFFGHIGVGIIHPHFSKNQKNLIDEMYSLVEELGGQVSGEHGIGIKKKNYIDSSTKKHFQNLKDKYDPNDWFGGGSIL